MRDKFPLPLTLGFLARFAVVFGLLIAPWPGWNAAYAQYFRDFAQAAFSSDEGKRVVVLSANKMPGATLDTRLSLANREQLDAFGKGPIRRTEIDTRSIGWIPTALTLALVIASPVPWRRRALALLAGMAMIHLYVLFTLQTWIWNNSASLALGSSSAFWQRIADDLNYTFMDQLGVSFTVPVLVWVLVTFKRNDERV